MLVRGTQKHIGAIKDMALAFFQASPYTELGIDEDRVHELTEAFVTANPYDKIVILWLVDDKPVGVLVGVAEKNLFNNRRIACEVVWWLDPDHRKGTAATKMLDAYEYWAKSVDCQAALVVDLLGNLDKYYTRRGYERREMSYLKVL